MYKKLILALICLATLLLPFQFATADFLIANGSPTEPAWVIYSTWQPADADWPAGFRTRGWYKIEPGDFRNLSIPENNTRLYIRIERPYDTEIIPPDAATRGKFPFWRHPSKGFITVENAAGELLESNFASWELETVELYEYENGGRYTITATECPIDLNIPVDQLYEQAMQSVLWIENLSENAEGSGVLIDAERKLAVTNQHVVGDADFVFVSFPVSDRTGELIGDRDYYDENYLSLALNGNGSWARVIATDAERDLAILQLDFIREGAREINHDFTTDPAQDMNRNDVVHILGNPGGQELWRWTLGLYQSDDGAWQHINADVYQGNSGGPVLNGRGELIGIIALGDQRTETWAAPARFVQELLDTVRPRHTIRFENSPSINPMSYEIKWSPSGTWREYQTPLTHWLSGDTLTTGYPLVRFDADPFRFGGEKTYAVDTFLRYFGDDYGDHVNRYDAYTYIFDYDPRIDEFVLYRSDNDGCVPLDVNGDGLTDIRDLEYIASHISSWSPPANADVDSDGDVDVSDIIFAAGLTCTVAGAPSLIQGSMPAFTSENLQRWIEEGKALGSNDPTFQRGIAVLEQFLAAVTQQPEIPEETALMPNFPNPFNPETWIPYKLSKPAEVKVSIYAADGRLVRTLDLGHQAAGIYEEKNRAAYWDGRNETGEPIASGLYFYTFTAGEFSATRKMLIAK